MAVKRIYFEPTWKMHIAYRELISNPPEGYEFIVTPRAMEKLSSWLSRRGFSYQLMMGMYRIAPLPLIKSILEGFFKKIPDCDLIFSQGHLVFRKKPWVIEFGSVIALVGLYRKHFERYRRVIEHAFASEYCKKILCWTEHTKRTVLSGLDCTEFEHKIEVVPRTVPPKNFTKSYSNDKVRLFFLGSANVFGEFEARGGKEVLEAFSILCRKYDNLELVVRSDIPDYVKRKYLGLSGLKLIEEVISSEDLDNLYRSADIFLFPGHYSSWLVILEAMSYELPVIATDVDCSPELIEHGRNGFLIKKSQAVPCWEETSSPGYTTRFSKAVKTVDPKVVQELVEKTSILIENQELRRKMGRAARREVEHGKFSLENRNKILKRIFDEATGSSCQ